MMPEASLPPERALTPLESPLESPPESPPVSSSAPELGKSSNSRRDSMRSLTRQLTGLKIDVQKSKEIYNALVLGDAGGDKAWINTTRANTYIGGVILLNAIVLGLETDLRPSGDRTWYWVILENFFAVVFFIEFLMRLHAERWAYFKSAWNLFDLSLVIMTSID